MFLTAAAILVGAYGTIAAAAYFAQGALIYPAPRAIAPKTGGFEEISYPTADGLDLVAGYRAAEGGKPTVVYFHGNGADWTSSVVATDRLVPNGYGVLAAEYRGYRGNPGSPSEQGFYKDGQAAFAYLASRGVAADSIVVIGNSIGSGVAVQMAVDHSPLALVLISPFASLTQLVAEKARWLPTGLLLRDRYDNHRKLPDVAAPILILHGDADTLIPHPHANRLAQANASARLIIFEGYGHDLAWHDVAEDAVLEFLHAQTSERAGE
ncbi:alpha/beta hydrolase [Qipengyuania zhejiangensis]|uniref:alpha/beta hydrolase n=1 Tax=Qipengyuania zhejiangensis TaxID=3077782 RepID=UPI002D793CA1|nr:alpha/beta fold hydrolase [Qipengyuania sp. Z2]